MNNNKSQEPLRHFSHLNQNDRDRIELLTKQGYTQKEIAQVLGCNQGTISREYRRKKNTGVYVSSVAQHKASIKRSNSKYQGMKIEKNPVLKKRIIKELHEKRSPDEISGMLKREGIIIGKDAIYKWLYSVYGTRYTHLLCTKRIKKKKQKVTSKRTLIPNRISVYDRPEEGIHAQADTLVSGKKCNTSACASLLVVENTKLMLGSRMDNLKPQSMVESVRISMSTVRGITDVTMDNGIENRNHEQFPVRAYFCDPYSPWQKPLVEGSIGLMRRWFIKKGTNLDSVSNEMYQGMLNILNHKKRKSLGYKSAYEVSLEHGMIESIPEKYAFEGRI